MDQILIRNLPAGTKAALRARAQRNHRSVEAAAPILRALAAANDYRRLAVFGSVARRSARQDSDIDLIVEPPEDASSFGFIRFKQLIERVLGRRVDLVDYGGLKPSLDDDIRRDAVLL